MLPGQVRAESAGISGGAGAIAEHLVIETQFVAEVIIHRGEIDSRTRADIAHFGRLETGFGEYVAGGFEDAGFRIVTRDAAWGSVGIRHMKQYFKTSV